MAKQTLTVKVSITGVREVLTAFRKLPKDASNALRDKAGELAAKLASSAQQAGQAAGGQAAAVAQTVRVVRDRLPAIQAGGARRITRSGAKAWQLLFGSEFGANGRYGWYAASKYADSAGRQFPPHQGQQGMWFFPTVEREAPTIAKGWHEAVDEIVTKFGSGA